MINNKKLFLVDIDLSTRSDYNEIKDRNNKLLVSYFFLLIMPISHQDLLWSQ